MLAMLNRFLGAKTKHQFTKEFFSSPYHEWIKQNKYIRNTFEEFFELLPESIIKKHFSQTKLFAIPSSGLYGCAISKNKSHIIVIFPELRDLLKSSANRTAIAMLAHEFGHIIYEHSDKSISVLEAQKQADAFACELGLGHEIEEFLLSLPECLEKRIRLTYVTGKIMLAKQGNLKNHG